MVAKWKTKAVEELKDLIKQYDIVAVVDLNNLPAKQLQDMKGKLRGDVTLKVAKKRLIKLALEDLESEKKGLSELSGKLRGIPGLLLTNSNPFKLYKTLEQNKSPAPLKAGQEAPKDVWIKAGPTGFLPGPIIGELGQAGLKTSIDKGKVAIKEDKKVLEEGEVCTEEMASLLQRLDILPGEVGLNLTGVYEDGFMFEPKVLRIDEDEYMANIMSGITSAINLSVNSGFVTSDTAGLIISDATRKAVNVAVEAAYLSKDTAELIVSKAVSQVFAVSSGLPDEALSDELKGMKTSQEASASSSSEEKKDEAKEEEKKEEESSDEDAMAGLGSLFG